MKKKNLKKTRPATHLKITSKKTIPTCANVNKIPGMSQPASCRAIPTPQILQHRPSHGVVDGKLEVKVRGLHRVVKKRTAELSRLRKERPQRASGPEASILFLFNAKRIEANKKGMLKKKSFDSQLRMILSSKDSNPNLSSYTDIEIPPKSHLRTSHVATAWSSSFRGLSASRLHLGSCLGFGCLSKDFRYIKMNDFWYM